MPLSPTVHLSLSKQTYRTDNFAFQAVKECCLLCNAISGCALITFLRVTVGPHPPVVRPLSVFLNSGTLLEKGNKYGTRHYIKMRFLSRFLPSPSFTFSPWYFSRSTSAEPHTYITRQVFFSLSRVNHNNGGGRVIIESLVVELKLKRVAVLSYSFWGFPQLPRLLTYGRCCSCKVSLQREEEREKWAAFELNWKMPINFKLLCRRRRSSWCVYGSTYIEFLWASHSSSKKNHVQHAMYVSCYLHSLHVNKTNVYSSILRSNCLYLT